MDMIPDHIVKVLNCILPIESHRLPYWLLTHESHRIIPLANTIRHQYLCWMTPTNFLKVEVILLLLLRAHIGDLRMGGLVPETKKLVNGVPLNLWDILKSLGKVFSMSNLTDRLHTWCSSPGCTLWSGSGCSPRSSNAHTGTEVMSTK